MAYPTVSAPYGLIPVNLIGGQVYAGATRMVKIASAYATNIFFGDVVKITTDGTLIKETGTTTANPVGIFMGCQYTNSQGQLTNSQYWPASTVATDAVAYVADDPDLLFKVASVSATTTVAGYGRTLIGSNVSLVQNSGSTVTGDSKVAIDGTSAATTISLPIRIVDVVVDTATGSDTFVEWIVKWNVPYFTLAEGTPNTITWAGGHQYLNPLGIA